MILKPHAAIAWHSTRQREELLMPLTGTLRLEREAQGTRRSVLTLAPGVCLFIPQATRHRVVNPSRRTVRYLYLTG